MAIIPRYTSRALPPGAQPGLTASAIRRGEAGAGLAAAFGDTAIAGIGYKLRKDAMAEASRKPEAGKAGADAAAASLAGQIAAEKRKDEDLDHQNRTAQQARSEATITKTRAESFAATTMDGGPAKGMRQRALAKFDGETARLAAALKDQPHLKAGFEAMVESNRAPLELRMLRLENARRIGEQKAELSDALDLLALAASDDPAMAPGVTGRGLAQIEAAMKAGMLDAKEAAAMQGGFADRVHMSAMRGQIGADPAGALGKLESGAFDDIFDAPAREQLLGEARAAARVKAAGAAAAARAKRRGLELYMATHLAALDETGKGDEALEARARAELPADEHAAFQASEATARERPGTRAEYAFMTSAEIEADIAQQAPGGGPRGTDERDAAHTIRSEICDEVLTARTKDPAGWAMRDADVAASFAAARENPDDPILARRAQAMRLALQREMGIAQPRLLSDAERDEIAESLAGMNPADRVAIVAALRDRYGAQANMLAAELTGEVGPNTALLIAHAEVPHLPRLIAQGMEKAKKDSRATLTLAGSEALDDLPALPIIDEGEQAGRKLDMTVLKPGQHYRTSDGGVLRYDGEALTPVTVESAAPNPADSYAPTPPLPLGKASPKPETAVMGIAYERDDEGNPVAVDVGENPGSSSALASDSTDHSGEATGAPASLLEAFDRADAGDSLEDMGLVPDDYPSSSTSANPVLAAVQSYMAATPGEQTKMRVWAVVGAKRQDDFIDGIKAGGDFMPAVFLEEPDIEEFNSNKNSDGVRAVQGDDEVAFSLGDGPAFLTLPDDAAAVLVRNWDEFKFRLGLLSRLFAEDLPPEEMRRLIEAEVYKDIPESERGKPTAMKPDGTMYAFDDPYGGERFMARMRMRAFDELVEGIRGGATDEEIAGLIGDFQQIMLPELMGAGRFLKEFAKDMVPGLNNVRSGTHFWNDLIEIEEEWKEGDVTGLAGNSLLLLLDGLGMIPIVGSAFAPVRSGAKKGARAIGKMLPRVDALVAQAQVWKHARQWTNLDHKIDPSRIFGEAFDELPKKVQGWVRFKTNMALGAAGERYLEGLLRQMDPAARGQTRVTIPEEMLSILDPAEKRIYDAWARRATGILVEDIAGWFSRRFGKQWDNYRANPEHYEFKTGKQGTGELQEKVDSFANENPGRLRDSRGNLVTSVRNARIYPKQIPMELAIADAETRLGELVGKNVIDAMTSRMLLDAMRAEYKRGTKLIGLFDYAGVFVNLLASGGHRGRSAFTASATEEGND